MRVFSPTEEELLSRLRWFVKLRWLFLVGLAGVLFFAVRVFGLGLKLTPLLIISGIMLVYNLGFYLTHQVVRRKSGREATARGLRIEANLQIGLDLLALIFLIHFGGGIENPFIFFFIFHMIMGSILMAGRDIWFHALGAVGILLLLQGLAFFRVIPHYSIQNFVSDDLWRNVPYIWAGVISFAATIFMAVYMTNSISRSLRRREGELLFAKNQLENKSLELERLNQELIRQQRLLFQTEKLASLGKLSAGVAHELNSPLTGILSFSHFIKDACSDSPQITHDVDIVIRETERCKKIIKGLVDFARQSQPEKKPDDIIQLLNKTISLVENHKDFKHIEFVKSFPEDLAPIMIDKDQIQQVIMNMIVNAQEAMASGGTIYISARVQKDNNIEIKFTDTGSGIDKDHLRNIFDPFFTTKEDGTGLGLSISLGIIESHGGNLDVESLCGEGSTFIINLPIS
jgi:signal transduction histidine kinase